MKKLLFIGILLMGLSLQGWTQEKTITVTGIVTDTEKEQIELRKREMQRVANNNGGKNPILGY